MRTVKDQLEEIIQYYQMNRGVGHTHAMLQGATDIKSLIVVHDNKWGHEMRTALRNYKSESHPVTLDQLTIASRGLRLPLAWDNHVLETLLRDALFRITNLEYHIEKFKEGMKP